MQAIIYAIGAKYDCPIAITPKKSRNPVNLLGIRLIFLSQDNSTTL